jgi:catechol 2,3-dioxygenase-like lactoylglutathione lyase family enzyme
VSQRPPQLDYNYPQDKQREVNKTQRFKPGPAMVDKLGHFGCCVTDFEKTYNFYTTHFNLKASDLIHDSTGKDITAFLHLDRGMTQVDHHTFFFFEGLSSNPSPLTNNHGNLFSGPKFHIHHSSFEVHDFDVQALGHQWLQSKGYDLAWGVGRHVLGSQIFDYWYCLGPFNCAQVDLLTEIRFDTSKFILEHYGSSKFPTGSQVQLDQLTGCS